MVRVPGARPPLDGHVARGLRAPQPRAGEPGARAGHHRPRAALARPTRSTTTSSGAAWRRRWRAGASAPSCMPLSQMDGVQQSVAQLLTMMPATSRARTTRTSSRGSQGVPHARGPDDRADARGPGRRASPRRGSRCATCRSRCATRSWTTRWRARCCAAFQRFPETIAGAERERLRAARPRRLSRAASRPPTARLLAFLEDEYIPRTRETIAPRDAARRRGLVRLQGPPVHDHRR